MSPPQTERRPPRFPRSEDRRTDHYEETRTRTTCNCHRKPRRRQSTVESLLDIAHRYEITGDRQTAAVARYLAGEAR